MFKHQEKRFEYDISSHMPEDRESYSYKYSDTRNVPEYPISATTPINRRAALNQSTGDAKEKHHFSTQDPSSQVQKVDQRYAQRSRGNSASGFKKSIERNPGKLDKSHLSNQGFRQMKKVYLGGEDLYKQGQSANIRLNCNQRGNYFNDENKRNNGEEVADQFLPSGTKVMNARQSKDRRNVQRWQQMVQSGPNEKQIMQKIVRINRLNEQINSRLQRMLSKIERA